MTLATMGGCLNGTCPCCGSDRPPLLWAQDGTSRTWRCQACRGQWSADGAQAELFAPAEVAGPPLALEIVTAYPTTYGGRPIGRRYARRARR